MDKQITISKYKNEDRDVWNQFLSRSKNGLFMFDRNYMEYHSDRFKDHSLLFYEDNELVALFPANVSDGVLKSHGGLTYGGFILNDKIKQHTVIDCVVCLKEYALTAGFRSILYKAVPHIYHMQPAEEDIYALHQQGASIDTLTASTVINLKDPIRMPKGRKAQISRARREGVEIRELTSKEEYVEFMKLEDEVLRTRHGISAVHTGDEMYMLYSRFPDNIHLFGALHAGSLIAGTVVYEYRNAVHTQYMATNDKAREIGALDLAITTVIEKYRATKDWLDFGISTDHSGLELNEGLISQKEGFGGRTNVYTQWEIRV